MLCGHALEAHRIFRGVSIDAHVVAGQDRAFENLQRQRVLYQPLNRPAERPRAVCGIVPFTQEQLFGRVRHFYADAAFGQEFLDAAKQQVHDSLELFLAQRIEDHDFINTVEKLRTERRAQRLHGLLARSFRIALR